jgi:hypothetical protein
MGLIGTFPAREQVREWLKAGVVDRGRYAPTDEGTPADSSDQCTIGSNSTKL